jgi:general secretion pathway protein C
MRHIPGSKIIAGFLGKVPAKVVAMVLLITILVYQGVGLLYHCLSLALIRTMFHIAAPAHAAGTVPTNVQGFDAYRVVLDRNLFRSTDKAAAGPGGLGAAGSTAEAMGQIELRGTVAGDNRYAFAIIEEKDKKKQVLYRIGDRVGDARLVQIKRASVVLRSRDRDMVLKIPETTETSILPSSGGGVMPAQATLGTVNVSRNEISRNLKDMGTMLTQAQIRPYFNQGYADGFIVSNIRPGSIYQRIGLQDGDILQGVNDRKIQAAEDMIEFYNILKSANQMTLRIKRQDQSQAIQYTFN